MEKLVSVIIPVYNREKYIEECIGSIFEQSYQDFEIILVDDGSTDNTLEICNHLAEKDSRIKVFISEHLGVSAARNKAIEQSSGEYLFFIDSDDIIHPLLLESLVKGIEENNISISATYVFNIREEKWGLIEKAKAKYPAPPKIASYTYEETLEKVFHGKSPLGQIGGVMMRRDYVAQTRFRTDIYIGEDFYFIYENLIKGTGAAFLEQKWYYCRLHENNSSWDYKYSGFWTRFYRRKLVWESEEKLRRTEYSNIVKKQAVDVFSTCYNKNKLFSADTKKMRKIMRQYKKVLLPAMNVKGKLYYLLSVYAPCTYKILLYMWNKLKKVLKR